MLDAPCSMLHAPCSILDKKAKVMKIERIKNLQRLKSDIRHLDTKV